MHFMYLIKEQCGYFSKVVFVNQTIKNITYFINSLQFVWVNR